MIILGLLTFESVKNLNKGGGGEKYETDKVLYCAGILGQSMGARNRVGIELSYRPAKLHRLAKSIP